MCMAADLWEDLPDEEVRGRHLQPGDDDDHRGRLHRQDAGRERKHSEASDLVKLNQFWFKIIFDHISEHMSF